MTDAAFHVSFVCSGNICRSPMGEVVLRSLADDAGLGDRIAVSSFGTGPWHEGEQADHRARQALAERGYDGESHRARQISAPDIAPIDLLIALDRGHRRHLTALGADPDRVRLLTEFDPEHPSDPDVFDPYYSDVGVYRDVLAQVERSCRVLLDEILPRINS